MPARSKYTPETVTKIVNALSVGMIDGDACVIGGISEATFYAWQQTKPEFLDRTTRARREGWQTALAMLKRGALDGDVRAIEAFLDRTHSPYRKAADVTVTHGGEVTHASRDLSVLTRDELVALTALSAKLRAPREVVG